MSWKEQAHDKLEQKWSRPHSLSTFLQGFDFILGGTVRLGASAKYRHDDLEHLETISQVRQLS